MQEEIAKGFVAVAKFIAYYVIWSLILFNLGLDCCRFHGHRV